MNCSRRGRIRFDDEHDYLYEEFLVTKLNKYVKFSLPIPSNQIQKAENLVLPVSIRPLENEFQVKSLQPWTFPYARFDAYQAAMFWLLLADLPKTDCAPKEFVFAIDCSGIEQAGDCLALFIRSLPTGSSFNVVRFGTTHDNIHCRRNRLTG
jgi:hypothetical protein